MRQEHIDKDEHLREHHYHIAEAYPFDLMVLFLIIILLDLTQTSDICPVEDDYMNDAVDDEKNY